jgi:electron transfer flavoprotein alpha subunit
LYIAWGISGAVQHVASLGQPDHVVSVNTDPSCPMMAMADHALVADAPRVHEALARLLGLTPPEAVSVPATAEPSTSPAAIAGPAAGGRS